MTSRARAVRTPPAGTDLPDVNVWLALAVREHPHHLAAQAYWTGAASPSVCFCRVTMLGLVRLLSQPRVMGSAALAAADALTVYEQFVALPEVELLAEPASTGAAFRRHVATGLPARLLTDAYLAAFAVAGGFRLVSFDRDFERFDGLDRLLLRPTLPMT